MGYLVTDGVHYIRGNSILTLKPGYKIQVDDIESHGDSTMCEVLEVMTDLSGHVAITVDKLTNMGHFKFSVLKASGDDVVRIHRRIISMWSVAEEAEDGINHDIGYKVVR